MRALPAAVKISLIVVNLLVMVVLVLAVVSIAMPGNLDADLPPESDWNIGFMGNEMVIDVPLRVFNGGSFDITDFQVGVAIEDGLGGYLVQQETAPQDVNAGGWTNAPIHLAIDLNTIPNQTLERIVFTNDTFPLQLSASAGYLFSLANGRIQIGQNVSLGPMVYGLNVDINHSHLVPQSGHVDLVVPFWFSNQDYLDGQILSASGTLRNSTATLGSLQQTYAMPLQGTNSLVFHLSNQAALHLATHSDHLTASLTFDFHGAEMSQTYILDWEPPTP